VTRGWRIGIGIVVTLVALALAVRALNSLTGGTPGGPRSSSYATGETGLGAYAELLGRAGHRIDRLRRTPHAVSLDPRATVVLLDPPGVARRDADALRAFVAAGGTLVAGGGGDRWLGTVVPDPPRSVTAGVRDVRAHGLGSVRRLVTAGEGAWRNAGRAQPLAGASGRTVLARARVGRGRVFLLADPSPLQNRLLGDADNAALGLTLAGPATRPVDFLETYHGYGRASGLAALPLAWKLLFSGLFLSALVYMVARGRRLGPPEQATRELPPPRREYVDSLAATLARTKRRDDAVERVRRHVRAEVLRRTACPPDADDGVLRAAARRLGLDDAEAAALIAPVRTDDDVLAVGRTLARIGQDLPE
jgi:hypothetical protein